MAKTNFVRIAVAGATIDGRTIDPAWIDQMAATYDPNTYTARINCEHLAGFSPDAPFNAYGSVLALKADNAKITLDGKEETRRALFAELDANDQLVTINKAGQKLFTSCEIAPKFAGTDKAYLVGLAVTDNPASIGTEALKFSAGAGTVRGTAIETTLELAAAPAQADTETAGLIAAAKAFFTGLTAKSETQKPPVVVPPADNDNDAKFGAVVSGMEKMTDALAKMSGTIATFGADVGKLRTDHDALVTRLASTEAAGSGRQPATGGSGAILADF